MSRSATAALRFGLAVVGATLPARAQSEPDAAPPAAAAPPITEPAAPAGSPATTGAPRPTNEVDPAEHFAFRHTWITWDHTVTTQTLGVGKDYQSSNPTYLMSASLQPRYYPYDGENDAIYIDGRLDLIHEFTNSDVSTERGETTFSDANIVPGYVRMLHVDPEYETFVAIRAPSLTLPTSKFSANNGTILGLGAEGRFAQTLPLAGSNAPAFQRLILRATAGYNHTFTRSVVPTNAELHRVRLGTDGRTVSGDQLSGAAFPEHEVYLRGRLLVDILDRLAFWFEASYQPTWKYGFGDTNVCVVTGCAPAERPSDPSRFVVVTAFQSELMFEVLPELGLSVGYINAATQPGPDGQRRSILYSPGAEFYLSFVGYLDALYFTLHGQRPDYPNGHHLRP